MQDNQLSPPDLCGRWDEQVSYFGTRQFSKRLANVLDILHVPSSGPATPPPVGIVEVDHEEGSNPRSRPQLPGRLAPPLDAAERGGFPRPFPQLTSPVATAPVTAKAKTSLSACQTGEQSKAGALERPLSQVEHSRANRINGPANRSGRQQQGDDSNE